MSRYRTTALFDTLQTLLQSTYLTVLTYLLPPTHLHTYTTCTSAHLHTCIPAYLTYIPHTHTIPIPTNPPTFPSTLEHSLGVPIACPPASLHATPRHAGQPTPPHARLSRVDQTHHPSFLPLRSPLTTVSTGARLHHIHSGRPAWAKGE